MSQRSFVLVKPDGVQRGLVGEVIRRFEARGLKLVGLKMVRVTQDLAATYYAEHKDKAFYDGLLRYVTSGPAVAMVVEGEGAVAVVRKMMGATDPAEAEPGTIRADHALTIARNVLHGSDSPESAEREIGLFFSPEELHAYTRIDEAWLRG